MLVFKSYLLAHYHVRNGVDPRLEKAGRQASERTTGIGWPLPSYDGAGRQAKRDEMTGIDLPPHPVVCPLSSVDD